VARPLATCLLTVNKLGLFVPKPSTSPVSLPHRTVDLLHAVR